MTTTDTLYAKHPPVNHRGTRPFHLINAAHQKTLHAVMDRCMEGARVLIDYAMSSWTQTVESQAQLRFMEGWGDPEVSDAATALLRVHAERRLTNLRNR